MDCPRSGVPRVWSLWSVPWERVLDSRAKDCGVYLEVEVDGVFWEWVFLWPSGEWCPWSVSGVSSPWSVWRVSQVWSQVDYGISLRSLWILESGVYLGCGIHVPQVRIVRSFSSANSIKFQRACGVSAAWDFSSVSGVWNLLHIFGVQST